MRATTTAADLLRAFSGQDSQGGASVRNTSRAETEAGIRAKVACEKAAYEVQWSLLEPGVTAEELNVAARVLQPHHYEDVVTERAIDGLCGYPPCSKAAPRKGQGPKLHVSIDDRKVYDISSLHCFCDRECARRSHEYISTLSTTSLFLREGQTGLAAAPTAAVAPTAATLGTAAARKAAVPSAAAAVGATWSAATAAAPSKRKPGVEAPTLGPVIERADAPPSVHFPSPGQGKTGTVEGYTPRGGAMKSSSGVPPPNVGVMSLAEAQAASTAARRARAAGAGASASARRTAERTGLAALDSAERTVRIEYGTS